jgi:hypothetical protein
MEAVFGLELAAAIVPTCVGRNERRWKSQPSVWGEGCFQARGSPVTLRWGYWGSLARPGERCSTHLWVRRSPGLAIDPPPQHGGSQASRAFLIHEYYQPSPEARHE